MSKDAKNNEIQGAVPGEYHLKVFDDRSELVLADGTTDLFVEGQADDPTKKRYKKITDALSNGFLRDQIRLCRDEPQKLIIDQLSDAYKMLFDGLVSSMTSEVGRALVGLTVLQLAVKAIEPSQSIRLHKGGSRGSGFGWRQGISMRSIDTEYITPVLREEGLVKLNSFGFMMTRTLAENYPYTKVYKAAMRGARAEWIDIVDGIERGEMQPLPALQYFLAKLLNNAAKFEELAIDTLKTTQEKIDSGEIRCIDDVLKIVGQHMSESSYAARIMEISMHALMQALQEVGALGSASLIPLSQMRSANKKHGNIGDIELHDAGKIIEAWDAKYGKVYLRDELEELNDKLEGHDAVMEAGFVTSDEPSVIKEIEERVADIAAIHNVDIKIISLDAWVRLQIARAHEQLEIDGGKIAAHWLTAYVESLSQRRHKLAPIDEPCYQWLSLLNKIIKS